MRGRGLWWLIAVLAGCDTPGDRCGDGEAVVGVVCRPNEATVRVGYGFAPAAMIAGDFDGDGALDAAAASPATRTVTIAWGPERAAATTFAFNSEIAGLAGGDVNGDGRVDLVVALPTRDSVGVLVATGGRGFERGEDVAVGAGPRAVLVADLDRDGRGELITADAGDDAVSVVRSGEREAVKVGAGPRALAAGDFDGDGVMDVAVALTDTAEVQVLRGGSSPGARVKVGAGPLAIVAVDVDGDGVDELATADALADTVSVIDGEVVRAWPVPARPRGLVVVRGDGAPGLAVLSGGTGEVSRLDPRSGAVASTSAAATALAGWGDELIAGGPGVTMAVRERTGLRLRDVWRVEAWLGVHTPIDVDGDGRDELVVDSDSLLGLLVVSGVDGSVIGKQVEVPEFEQERVLVGGDVDGDGRTDIVVAGRVAGDPAVVSLLQGDEGTFVAGATWMTDGARAITPVLADFDGDGGVGLAIGVEDDEGARLLLLDGDGAGGWLARGEPSDGLGEGLTALVVVDHDGDARLDLMALSGDKVLVFDAPGLGWGEPTPQAWLLGERGVAAMRLGDGGLAAIGCHEYGALRTRVPGESDEVEWLSSAPCLQVVARDGDGDGDVDVFLAEERPVAREDEYDLRLDGAHVVMFDNDGTGALTLVSRELVPDVRDKVVFAELDGAGTVDVVANDRLFTTARIGEIGAVPLAESAAVVADADSGMFADLDGDGVLDRVQVGTELAAALATERGGFGPWRSAPLTTFTGVADLYFRRDFTVGDVDGDGADEVVLLQQAAELGELPLSSVTVIDVDAEGMHGETVARLSGASGELLVADLDGDEAAEVVLIAEAALHTIRVTLLRAADGYRATTQQVTIPGRYQQSALYDMNGDGHLDLVMLAVSAGASLMVHVARGQGDGLFRDAGPWGVVPLVTAFTMRDVDGDRGVDFVATRGVDWTEVVVVRGGRGGRSLGATRRLGETGVDAVAFADLDGDGAEELLTGYANSGDFPVSLTIGRPVGDGTYVQSTQLLPEAGAVDKVLELRAHDWDSDGRPDIAVVDAAGFTIVRQVP